MSYDIARSLSIQVLEMIGIWRKRGERGDLLGRAIREIAKRHGMSFSRVEDALELIAV